jgi:hypothetical protein
MAETQPVDIKVNPLTYYQKPVIGQDNNEDLSPVQILFPTGGFGIGVAYKNPNQDANGRNDNHTSGMIASAPAYTDIDQTERRGLTIAFITIGIVNIILTSLMFAYADVSDSSKVEAGTAYLPSTLEEVPPHRRSIEKINFGFTILLMIIGMISVIAENTLGLSIYCLGIILNFLLGTSALPYFVYSFRYILDIGMLYIGLVIRSRFMYTFLPLHIHRA